MVTLLELWIMGTCTMDTHTLEAKMGHVQWSPLGPLTIGTFTSGMNTCNPTTNDVNGTYTQKRVYATYIPWDSAHGFLVGEESKSNV